MSAYHSKMSLVNSAVRQVRTLVPFNWMREPQKLGACLAQQLPTVCTVGAAY